MDNTNVNSLKRHILFVLQKMDELEKSSEWTIHQMADLERYARTLQSLTETLELIDRGA